MARGLGLVFLLLLAQDKATLGKALAGMDKWQSYHYRISVRNLTSKKDESRAGEFIFPKIITMRKSVLEIAKRGDKAMVNQGKGYVPLDEVRSSSVRSTVEKLEPPHVSLLQILDAMEKVQKEKKDEVVDNVKCRVYHSALKKEEVQKYAQRFVTAQLEKYAQWADCTAEARVYVGKDDQMVHRILFSHTIKAAVPGVRGTQNQTHQYEELIEFFELDKATVGNLPEAVRKHLEIVD
jgi:hypothetical protein